MTAPVSLCVLSFFYSLFYFDNRSLVFVRSLECDVQSILPGCRYISLVLFPISICKRNEVYEVHVFHYQFINQSQSTQCITGINKYYCEQKSRSQADYVYITITGNTSLARVKLDLI